VYLLIHSSQEFNTTQRSQFCVFAGDGVKRLRGFLTDLFNSITEEMNPQGDEDVGDSISYVHDDDSMDVDDAPPQVTVSPPVLQEQSPISLPSSSSATVRPEPRPHGHASHHSTLYHPEVRLHGTFTRDVEMSTSRVEHPSSSRNSRSTTRSSTHSPPPSFNPTPGPSRLNPTERLATSPAGSDGSSAGNFFRTYQSSSADGRPDGTLTPDLVFAEIGHGHGPAVWPGQDQIPNHAYQLVDPATLTVNDRPQFGASVSHVLGGGAWRVATQVAEVGQGPFGANGAFHGTNGHGANGTMNGTYHASAPHPLPVNGTNTHGINGAGIPSGITQGPPLTREERSRGRPRSSREPPESGQAPGQGQGRGPKRRFRSALNSVEQHATPFLFGRPLQDGEGSSASATTRKDDSTRGY
jgi:F-box and leucine-rich repeat protein GRR1